MFLMRTTLYEVQAAQHPLCVIAALHGLLMWIMDKRESTSSASA
jgi:hypothetical protein